VKAAVVNGGDVRPTLEWTLACSSSRLVCYRLITAPGPGPGPASSSERGASSWRPGHPVVVRTAACGTRLGGGPPHDGRFTKLVSAPEHSEDTPPRHILRLTSLRVHHCVPSSAHVRPCITAPHPSTSSGSAFAIKTGSDFGSPALLMIQGRQTAQQSSFSREFPVVWDRRGVAIIKSAGEPVSCAQFQRSQ
jgi:hypothetical protein